MGEYAEQYMHQQMREYAAEQAAEQAAQHEHESLNALKDFAHIHDMTVTRPSQYHVQVREDGKVVAEWWPSKGTTMAGGRRGPRCRTEGDVVAWMKML